MEAEHPGSPAGSQCAFAGWGAVGLEAQEKLTGWSGYQRAQPGLQLVRGSHEGRARPTGALGPAQVKVGTSWRASLSREGGMEPETLATGRGLGSAGLQETGVVGAGAWRH